MYSEQSQFVYSVYFGPDKDYDAPDVWTPRWTANAIGKQDRFTIGRWASTGPQASIDNE